MSCHFLRVFVWCPHRGVQEETEEEPPDFQPPVFHWQKLQSNRVRRQKGPSKDWRRKRWPRPTRNFCFVFLLFFICIHTLLPFPLRSSATTQEDSPGVTWIEPPRRPRRPRSQSLCSQKRSSSSSRENTLAVWQEINKPLCFVQFETLMNRFCFLNTPMSPADLMGCIQEYWLTCFEFISMQLHWQRLESILCHLLRWPGGKINVAAFLWSFYICCVIWNS